MCHNGVSSFSGCVNGRGCEHSATDRCADFTKAVQNLKAAGHEKNAEETGKQHTNGTALQLSSACAHEALIDTVIRFMDNDISISSLSEEAVKLLMLIPDGYIPVPHQVGGHRHVDGKFGKVSPPPPPPPTAHRGLTYCARSFVAAHCTFISFAVISFAFHSHPFSLPSPSLPPPFSLFPFPSLLSLSPIPFSFSPRVSSSHRATRDPV